MAMLLRTRKRFVVVKIALFLTVSFVYFLFASDTKFLQKDNNDDGLDRHKFRHLLTVNNACTPASINEFPSDGLTREQRQNGLIIIHIVFVCYLFMALAIICDDYFVPAIKKFCDSLHIKEDIAGATFMAMASSSPELFINCVGTFVTEGDIGVGAIVGSAVFNILAVPACCGLFATTVVELEWWPLSRDSVMYGVSVVLLITVLFDGKIYMYEALILIIAYLFYILIMCYNNRLMSFANRLVSACKRRSKGHYNDLLNETQPLLWANKSKCIEVLEMEVTLKDCEELEESTKIWEWPMDCSVKQQIWWVLTWPISFLLYLSTPDCRKYPKLYVITFMMCIFWIGITTYLISWIITVIGDTLSIPDSVMGLTFLAAGMSVPEAVSSVIVTNLGHGSMGLSSSIGSNTFDILLCLGVPWFIKTALTTDTKGRNWIQINSAGLNYSAVSLLSTLSALYFFIAHNKFRLDAKVGVACLVMYSIYLVFATLVELNVFFQVNLPTCDR